jgi:protein-disulfide isomerase
MKTDSIDRLSAPVSRRDHHSGPLNAAAQLLEYGDFECPACGAAHPLVKAIRETLGEKLCFAFRNFPLTNIHPHAESAAEAAEAAAAQGRYWEMFDTLFENQEALDYDDLGEYAAELGLDAARLINEVMNRAHEGRVREDFLTGVRSGVNGTPTFFINGVRYDGPRDLETMIEALAQPTGWA